MKRLLCVLLVMIIALFGLTACANGNNGTSGEHGGGVGGTVDNDASGNEQPNGSQSGANDNEVITKMYITINGSKLEVTLESNASTAALIERLKGGDITYTARDYGGFEKVGELGFSLPSNDTQMTTQSGDVILYSGDQIVLFYGSNSWRYTRLGRINGYTPSQLREAFGTGSVQVTISLN